MRMPIAAILCIAGLCSVAFAAKPWDGTYSDFKGSYLIYSGDLGEEAAPTSSDHKAALSIQGDMAKVLFDSIGPDLKDACGASADIRVREKGDLDCVHDKGDRASPYVCHFGINLRTGKSMRGSIC
ncbi:hypothetical protein ABIB42_001748 [Massilia sp. UYP32]|jgi:hypothetical protein|uniref:DUF3617 family protein n=2 Tax=Telluria group TaxID=2895353 RepID=K9DE28_9BURK|nr:hypothetical protein HMPREF9710_02135 [Massilia timonae CCUG 45783]